MMADDIDPASLALIKKLHRELNGLTRTCRRGRGDLPGTFEHKKEAVEGQKRKSVEYRRKPSPEGNDNGDESAGGGKGYESGGSQGEEGHARPAKRRKNEHEQGGKEHGTKELGGKEHSMKEQGAKEHGAKEHGGKEHSMKEHDVKEHSGKEQGGKEHGGKKERREGVEPPEQKKKSSVLVTDEPNKSSPGEKDKEAHGDPLASLKQRPLPKHALEVASALASVAVKLRATEVGSGRKVGGKHMIKCFHTGVRWGIMLAPGSIKTRGDLATALNDAFAGEILSCGQGDKLNVVFLDVEGNLTEFPSLRGTNMRESSTRWKMAVDQAVKVYVRRG